MVYLGTFFTEEVKLLVMISRWLGECGKTIFKFIRKYEKSKFGLALGIGVVLSMSMIVLAAGPSCKTTITNGGKTASGSTSMSSANFCSAVITATQESGEEKNLTLQE